MIFYGVCIDWLLLRTKENLRISVRNLTGIKSKLQEFDHHFATLQSEYFSCKVGKVVRFPVQGAGINSSWRELTGRQV